MGEKIEGLDKRVEIWSEEKARGWVAGGG